MYLFVYVSVFPVLSGGDRVSLTSTRSSALQDYWLFAENTVVQVFFLFYYLLSQVICSILVADIFHYVYCHGRKLQQLFFKNFISAVYIFLSSLLSNLYFHILI